ncbi:unnamed protein product, partial [Laminaria digitata]
MEYRAGGHQRGVCCCLVPDACNPNPCQNGGSCKLDPAGGHICTCATGYGGMSCSFDTE